MHYWVIGKMHLDREVLKGNCEKLLFNQRGYPLRASSTEICLITTVTPAKAGVQKRRRIKEHWIPAFARMTRTKQLHVNKTPACAKWIPPLINIPSFHYSL